MRILPSPPLKAHGAAFQQWYTTCMKSVCVWLTDRLDLQLHVYQLKSLIKIVKATPVNVNKIMDALFSDITSVWQRWEGGGAFHSPRKHRTRLEHGKQFWVGGLIEFSGGRAAPPPSRVSHSLTHSVTHRVSFSVRAPLVRHSLHSARAQCPLTARDPGCCVDDVTRISHKSRAELPETHSRLGAEQSATEPH
uniref:MUN domain-containing protein n=1 Tax=Knipowitschia caucasica TaxID=637954 RepID=A0AAV2KPN1_KNICA